MKVYTFKDLQDEVLAVLDESGDTGTTLTLVKNFIQQAHQSRLSAYPWPFMLWDTPITFATTPGVHLYPLHQEFFRPYYFFNRTSTEYLREVPSRNLGPDGVRWNTDEGYADKYCFWGRTCVQNQPSSTSTITIVSSSGSDTTVAKAVTIRGDTSDGVATESLTPTGTTPVASSTSFTKILQVTKAAAWAGTMTMTSNSGAITNLKLLPTEYGRSYQQIYLLQAPSGHDTIEYRFYRQSSPLVNNTDVPDIPAPFSRVLVWDALMLFAGYNTDVSDKAMAVWSGEQKKADEAMNDAYGEGRALEAMPRYVRYIGDYGVTRSLWASP